MNSNNRTRNKVLFAASSLTLLCLARSDLFAQTPNSDFSLLSSRAANKWMKTPILWDPVRDPVPSLVRQARDQYFDKLIGNREPLTPETAKGAGLSEGVWLPNQGEIPELPNRSVVIARFVSYQSVLSKSGRAIYTEATFLVDSTFEDSSGSAGPYKTFVLILPGGTIQTSKGIVLSFLTQPRSFSVEVGRTYLLAMSHRPTGNFFIGGRDWDVTEGIVRPNFSGAARISTTLVGLDLQQLSARLSAQLKK